MGTEAQKLRKAVLQAAISGKLVPQDPNDEPASALLERITAEKKQLIKEKKIKKQRPLPPVSKNDEPFDIPQSWMWVHMQDVLDIRDGTHDSPRATAAGVPLITGKNLKDGLVDFTTASYISEEDAQKINSRSRIDDDDIIFAMIGTIGNPVKVRKTREFAIKNIALVKHLPVARPDMDFIYYAIVMAQIQFNQESTGGVQKFVSLSYLRQYRMPIPPLKEQRRIVEKLEQLMPLIDEFEKLEDELAQLEAGFPEKLKQSLLKAALEGNLVEQNPNDEPASALLEKFAETKARWIREKRIQKPRASSLDLEEAKPFEIPDSWAWAHVSDVITNRTGLSYKKTDLAKKSDNMVRVLRGNNIVHDEYEFQSDDVMISAEYVSPALYLRQHQMITPAVSSLENIGKIAIIDKNFDDTVAGGFVLVLTPFTEDTSLVEYLHLAFQSDYHRNQMRKNTNKSGQAFYNLNRTKFLNQLIPIPPAEEQRRIVRKLEEVLPLVNELAGHITES